MKLPFGVRRLDELLKGGVPERSAVLVYGPPFIGKEILTKLFLLNALRQDVPAVSILTDTTASERRKELTGMEPNFPKILEKGLARFVDAYSRTIGASSEGNPTVEYVDGLLNFNAVNLAVNSAQRDLIRTHANHILVFDSLSTLIAYTNAATAFRFLQVLVGKTKTAGGTVLLLLGHGMHAEADVQMMKHLVDGVLEFKSENGKHVLNVQGLGVTDSRGWVEYKFGETSLELTGSFAAGRIH